jgi:hypothetical protein
MVRIVPQKINQIFGDVQPPSRTIDWLYNTEKRASPTHLYGRCRHFLSWSKGARELIERRLGKIILDPGSVGQRKLNAESDLWSCKFVVGNAQETAVFPIYKRSAKVAERGSKGIRAGLGRTLVRFSLPINSICSKFCRYS